MSAWLPLIHHARRAVRRAGWAGGLGFALLLLAMLLDFGGSAALEARREALGAERARLLQAGRAAGGAAAAGGQTVQPAVAFPAAAELSQLLTRLHAMGEERGLELSRSDYRSGPEPNTALTRVSLQLPVRGEFPAIYSWLDEVLAAMPAVALEGLSVRRGDSGLAVVEAELRLAIYVRSR